MKAFHALAVFALVASIVVFFSGCASTPSGPAVTVQTVRQIDVSQRKLIPRTSFAADEKVAAVVRNLQAADQVLQVEFVRADTGLVIWKNAITVARGRIYWTGPTFPLPSGAYAARVTGTGMAPIMASFTVIGR